VEINPASVDAHHDLAVALSQQGRIEQAITEWEKTLELSPRNLNAYCNLVWIFATFPDNRIRNGAKAVVLGERALELSGHQDPRVYRLLAAAYAENGEFDKAAELAQRGRDLAAKQESSELTNTLESDIELYRRRLPLHLSSE
jgi:Flp pilus assembly protein TadD